MKKYIVRSGDTMSSISQTTGVRMNLLMAANPQVGDPNRLEPGSVLSIPELGKPSSGGGSASAGSPMPGTAAPTTGYPAAGPPPAHGVQGGGLGNSGKFGGPPTLPQSSPVAGNAAANQAGRPTAYGGSPQYFGFVWPHVVRGGEAWHSIASQYQIPEGNLRRMNPNLPEQLRAGDIVYVPAQPGQMPAPGAPGAAGAMAQAPAAAAPGSACPRRPAVARKSVRLCTRGRIVRGLPCIRACAVRCRALSMGRTCLGTPSLRPNSIAGKRSAQSVRHASTGTGWLGSRVGRQFHR